MGGFSGHIRCSKLMFKYLNIVISGSSFKNKNREGFLFQIKIRFTMHTLKKLFKFKIIRPKYFILP